MAPLNNLPPRLTSAEKGFTLIELLAAIAIIAILSTLLIPAVGNALAKARKTVAIKNLRSIATAHFAYTQDGGESQVIKAQSAHDWARILAQYAGLNDPSIYILKSDPLVEAIELPPPRKIASPKEQPNASWEIDKIFARYPLSFAFANKLSSQAPASTTPLAWTRGLKENGYWENAKADYPSPYGNTGGYIVFLDGHVKWYTDLNKDDGALLHYVTREPTANIKEALSPGAEIMEFPNATAD